MTSTIQPDDLEDLLAAHAVGARRQRARDRRARTRDGRERSQRARAVHAGHPAARQLQRSPPRGVGQHREGDRQKATGSTAAGVVTPIGVGAPFGRSWNAHGSYVPWALRPRSAWSLQPRHGGGARSPSPRRHPGPTCSRPLELLQRWTVHDGLFSLLVTGKSATIVVLPNRTWLCLNGNRTGRAVPGSAYRLLGVTDHGNIELAEFGGRIKPTAFRLPQHVTGLVLEQGSAATGQQIASRVVGVPGAGSQPAHTPNTTGGSATTPQPSSPVAHPHAADAAGTVLDSDRAATSKVDRPHSATARQAPDSDRFGPQILRMFRGFQRADRFRTHR